MPRSELSTAIFANRLFDGQQWLENYAVVIEGEDIQAVLPASEVPADIARIDLGDGTLAPGLIDIQVNGGGGVMLNNDVTQEGVTRILQAHRSCGTTTIMPTLISDTPQAQRLAAAAVGDAITAGQAGILGLHIEGPFFDLQRRGTHKAEMIRTMAAEDLQWLCTLQSFPVILTLAPEHASKGQIQSLSEAGLVVCAGHTDASYDQINAAIAEGLTGFTHLFNAMKPLAAREPGTVGAALESVDTWAGIIADGHHVHPATIALAQRAKANGKLLLVSDSMSTVGSTESSFEIYGERIEESGGRLINAEGSLAGSAISLLDAVKYCHQQVGIELGECLRMASLYPAQFLQQQHKLGKVQHGHRADLTFFTKDFVATDTWVAGEHQHHLQDQDHTS